MFINCHTSNALAVIGENSVLLYKESDEKSRDTINDADGSAGKKKFVISVYFIINTSISVPQLLLFFWLAYI